jgi:hypothetical protein
LKSIILAAALLLPAPIAFAQTQPQEAAPAAPAAVAPKPVVRAARPAPKPVAKPAEQLAGLNVVQIVGIKQIDAATFEIDAKLADGNSVDLRMNAFVMQDLGRQLGTFGK